MILEDREELDVPDLPEEIFRASEGPDAEGGEPVEGGKIALPEGGVSLREVERELVRQALERTAGNQTRAAKLLRISRDALRYKMKSYGLGT